MTTKNHVLGTALAVATLATLLQPPASAIAPVDVVVGPVPVTTVLTPSYLRVTGGPGLHDVCIEQWAETNGLAGLQTTPTLVGGRVVSADRFLRRDCLTVPG